LFDLILVSELLFFLLFLPITSGDHLCPRPPPLAPQPAALAPPRPPFPRPRCATNGLGFAQPAFCYKKKAIFWEGGVCPTSDFPYPFGCAGAVLDTFNIQRPSIVNSYT
jgi:hypothetical protein